MAKQIYSIEWNGIAEVWIEVDHSDETEKLFHEFNNFWSESEERLERADGNITEAALKLLAAACFRFIVENTWGINQLISEFENLEGYPKMDGSQGLTIVNFDRIDFHDHDMDILIVGDKNDK